MISPPRPIRHLAIAFVISFEPPFATGQPTACAVRPSIKPTAEVKGLSKGNTEWAAMPANKPLAFSPRNQRFAKVLAE